jgi:hypothetical protein
MALVIEAKQDIIQGCELIDFPTVSARVRRFPDCGIGVCTTMVYTGGMATTRQVRRSVTLPAPLAKQVERIANRRRLSDNRVLVELIELGIEASKQKEKAFFELADRFRASEHPDEVKRLGDELGRFVFGE